MKSLRDKMIGLQLSLGNVVEVVSVEEKFAIVKVQPKNVPENMNRIYTMVLRPPGVRLIIPTEKGVKFRLNYEFRVLAKKHELRLTGGKVFETLEEYVNFILSGKDLMKAVKNAAIREGEEESGIKISSIDFYYKSLCGSSVEWDLYYFVVDSFELTEQKLESDETIVPVEILTSEILNTITNHPENFSEDRSAAILFRYLINKSAF